MLKIAVRLMRTHKETMRYALLSGFRKAVADGSLLNAVNNGEHFLSQ